MNCLKLIRNGLIVKKIYCPRSTELNARTSLCLSNGAITIFYLTHNLLIAPLARTASLIKIN